MPQYGLIKCVKSNIYKRSCFNINFNIVFLGQLTGASVGE